MEEKDCLNHQKKKWKKTVQQFINGEERGKIQEKESLKVGKWGKRSTVRG